MGDYGKAFKNALITTFLLGIAAGVLLLAAMYGIWRLVQHINVTWS